MIEPKNIRSENQYTAKALREKILTESYQAAAKEEDKKFLKDWETTINDGWE